MSLWERKLVIVLWVVLFSVLDPENTRILVCCFLTIFWEVKCCTSLSKQKVELCSCLWFCSLPLLPMRLFYMLPFPSTKEKYTFSWFKIQRFVLVFSQIFLTISAHIQLFQSFWLFLQHYFINLENVFLSSASNSILFEIYNK